MASDAVLHTPEPTHGAATETGLLTGNELRPGDLLAGRFRIEKIIGIGGMGVVYRARDLSLDIDVAIKMLRPELARRPGAFERFRSELLLARQVSSPHVVRIHDIAEHEGRWFISMDFVDGESLEAYRDRVGRIPLEGALAITRGLLEGLAAAHQRGVIHRDLKPANVLLDRNGQAYITDFGVARSLGATGMTQSGIIVGTPEYLSPEQARGEAADARSDLYTTGLILYEMLTGSLPFAGGTPAETVIQRIVRPPPSLAKARPDLPHWLHVFCDRLLKVRPSQRLASAKEALRAIESKRVPRPPLNRRVLFVAASCCVGVVIAGAYLWRHPIHWRDIVAPAAPVVTRVAVLPFDAPAADADLAAVARAIEAHAHEWLRADAAIAVVSRARIKDALARAAPDLHGDALVRQLPQVGRAAGATRLLTGNLRREANGLVLDLAWTDVNGHAAPRRIAIRGATAEALFASYEKAFADDLRSAKLRAGSPPALAAGAVEALGRGLVDLDHDKPGPAADALAPAAKSRPPSVLIDRALLEAEEGAHQDLPAENLRTEIAKRYAQATTPAALALRARALADADSDEGKGPTDLLAQAIKTFPNDPALALQNAEALADSGDNEQAMTALKSIVKLDDQDARAWYLLGRTSILLGQAQPAVDEYLLRSLVLNIRARDAAAEAQTRNALGIGYERLGQLDAAAEQYGRAASMRERLGDKSGEAKTLRNLAIVQAVKGDRDQAEKNLDKVKTLLEGLGDRASLADLYNDRGVVAEEQGDFAAALAAYRQALAIRQQLDVPAKIAESFNNVGFSTYQLGQLDNAFVYWQQALALYRKLDDENSALQIEQSMGLLDIARGHFGAARERFEASLKSAQSHQIPEEVSTAYLNLAELALAEGSYRDAADGAGRAEEILKRRSDLRGEVEANLLKARVSLALGDAGAAAKTLAAIPADQASSEQRAEFFLASARQVWLAGDAKGAAGKLDEAAKAAAEAHAGVLDFRIRLERARQSLANGEVADAGKLLKGLREETTLLGQVPLHLQLLELEIADALRAGRRTDAVNHYREALALLKDVGRFADATILHRLGARAYPAGSADAAAASAAAASSRAQLLSGASADARDVLQRQLDRRLREDLGYAS